jgi:XamI restriction endonuclease
VPRPPQSWSPDELALDAAESRRRFVKERLAALASERRAYSHWVEAHAQDAARLLATSNDLRDLDGKALSGRGDLETARYVTVPPISLDDLDALTDSAFGTWTKQKSDRGARPSKEAFARAAKIISERVVGDWTPWVREDRAPTEHERETFVHWTASVRTANRLATARRTERAARQETAIRRAVGEAGYEPATPPAVLVDPIAQMQPGTFASSSRRLGGANMDVPIRLVKGHATGLLFLALEAKVSNSTINSRKRLLEVMRKAETWNASGQIYSFRTAAVLAGSFDTSRLAEIQQAGVLIFWEHRLGDLTAFLRKGGTRRRLMA